MEKESSKRSTGFHPTHSMLVSSPAQRSRHQQQQTQYGHCIPPHRRQSDNPDVSQTILEQRRQSYDSSRLQQMMFEHSQSMMLPQHAQLYPPGTLSQADYVMMPPRGSEYYTQFRENHQDQLDWMGGIPPQSQSNPRRQVHPPRKDFANMSQTEIGYFMDDPCSPRTFNGDSNSQLGPSHNYHHRPLSQELHEPCELSDILSVNTPPVDNSHISQKMGYSITEMSQPIDHMTQSFDHMTQPIDHMTYMRKKSNESNNLTDMDHLSRSVHTLHDENNHKGDSSGRKQVRTHSTNQHSSHSNLKSMGSEPVLNMYGPPGLKSSILPRLAAPLEQLQSGNSSTLPHRNSKFSGVNHGRSQQRRHNHPGASHHSKQPGNLTQPGQLTTQQPTHANGGVSTITPDTRRSPMQDKTQTDQLLASSSATSLSSANSTSPIQERLQQQSPSNQKLRSSGR